jgi:hypothetical protein
MTLHLYRGSQCHNTSGSSVQDIEWSVSQTMLRTHRCMLTPLIGGPLSPPTKKSKCAFDDELGIDFDLDAETQQVLYDSFFD